MHVPQNAQFIKGSSLHHPKERAPPFGELDDATRIRALKIYKRHNQQNAINFVNYVIEKFPFRIQMIHTDRGQCPQRQNTL